MSDHSAAREYILDVTARLLVDWPALAVSSRLLERRVLSSLGPSAAITLGDPTTHLIVVRWTSLPGIHEGWRSRVIRPGRAHRQHIGFVARDASPGDVAVAVRRLADRYPATPDGRRES